MRCPRLLLPLLPLLLLPFVSLQAAPSLAVLDAVLEENIDPAVKVPVTEKIIEELVQADSYTVLDRSHVSAVLQEMEFQLSGMVKDTEIQKAGEYLGAEYVCVARVSKVGEVYFISAKIIDVRTGEITAQSSDQRRGTAEVIFSLAQNVGKKLRGEQPLRPAEEKEKEKEREEEKEAFTSDDVRREEEREAQRRPPAAGSQKKVSVGPLSHITMAYVIPWYFGEGVERLDTYYESKGVTDYSSRSWGIDIQYLQVLPNSTYLSAGILAARRSDKSDDFTDSGDYHDSFFVYDLRLTLGYIGRIGELFQPYGGAGISYFIIEMNDDAWDSFSFAGSPEDETIGYLAEAGLDIIPTDYFTAGLRLQLAAAELNGGRIFDQSRSFVYFALSFGAGYAY
jgi:TolB-like protein